MLGRVIIKHPCDTSALRQKADIVWSDLHFRYVPMTEVAACVASLQHFIRGDKEILGNGHIDLLGRLQVDNKLELGRLLHRKVTGICATQDLVDINCGMGPHRRLVRAITDQSAGLGHCPELAHHGKCGFCVQNP
jgi:hypothetical protein